FVRSVPVWIKEKLYIRRLLSKEFKRLNKKQVTLLFPEHHLSHACSAFYPSPFDEAAILTIDGVGEWATASICVAKAGEIKVCKELRFPHSLGLFYSAFTYYLGFEVNSGEYKLMGLAPYGDTESEQTKTFKQKILSEIIDIREDGSILLNMDYFLFTKKIKMTDDGRLSSLLGLARRVPGSAITQDHKNLALAVQEITESVVLALAHTAKNITQCKNLVMAGGVALNCTANSKLLQSGIFENIWIQPAAGDAGGALGAAYAAWHIWFKKDKKISSEFDSMKGAHLGPDYTDKEIQQTLKKQAASYRYYDDFHRLCVTVSQLIADGCVIGWFQDRMEFGPRALGNRSILADPGNPDMQQILNMKIKFREGFRPFAPAVLAEDAAQYFIPANPSPYMLFVSEVKEEYRRTFPAITHVDDSSRIQTVTKKDNPKFRDLLNEYKKITGHGMLINTSFNVKDEPIVCTPEDAWRCFMKCGMDFLVIGNYLIDKKQQYTNAD
ncbi:MAG TPA: carbamoyltransferase C-terminal domain-containing protein, partial [Puia sp.]|nr:carbamoyltransferase C-terminal domain-containing protein [Puia sp.]